jgi:hypothetical protein
VFNFQPLLFKPTFNTTTFVLFGETTSSLASNEIAGQESEFANAFNLRQNYLSHRGRLGPFYWIANTPGFRKACRISDTFVDAAAQKTLDAVEKDQEIPAASGKQYVFIDAGTRRPCVTNVWAYS